MVHPAFSSRTAALPAIVSAAAAAAAVAGLTALLLAGGAALAAPAPAGLVIENTAEASYEADGVIRTAMSNKVEVRVAELLVATAASLDPGPVTMRAGGAVLQFLVSNTGNGPEALALEIVTGVAGNGFDAVPGSIAADSNGNGAYDPGIDTVLPDSGMTAILAAGGSQRLFVLLSGPPGIPDGARSAVSLVARTATGTGAPGTLFAGAGESGVDAVAGPGGGMATATGLLVASSSSVTLLKSAVVADPFGGTSALPGATITYALRAVAGGSAPAENLVITDAVPQGTRYVANSLTLEGAPLTDAAGDDAGEASAARVAFALGSVPGGASRTATFTVLIED